VVKIGPAPRIIDFPYNYVYSKNLKNLLLKTPKIFIMKHLLMGVYQVCSNKSPWVKIGLTLEAYIQVSNFRAIMTLLFIKQYF
jgi:hypothetical protein